MQKEEQEHIVTGLLVGLTTCSHGGVHVTLDINGEKLHLNPDQAEFACEMIHAHLEALGYYGDTEDDIGIVEVRHAH